MEQTHDKGDSQRRRQWQFRLSELFFVVTVSAAVFAMMKWWGVLGFTEFVIFVAGPLATVMAIDYRIKKNLGW